MLQGPQRTIERARELRGEMSLPERLLWRELRKRPDDLKFRRQHPSGPYVADFFCHEAKLIVEVDGEAHDRGDRPGRDAARDAWFAGRRLRVMRIPAREVLGNLDGVVRGIVDRAKSSAARGGGARKRVGGVSDEGRGSAEPSGVRPPIPLHQPAAGPPPLSGEDR